MAASQYTAKSEDILIPSRNNTNNLKVVFTDEVKEQLTKKGQKLKDWQEIADRGFVGPQAQQGIKLVIHSGKEKIYELKSLGKESGDERCYAIQKDGVLFVLGYEDQKGQQQNHIEQYSKYDVEVNKVDKNKDPRRSISPTRGSSLNDKKLESVRI